MKNKSSFTIVAGAVVALLGVILVFAYGRSVQAGPGSGTLSPAYVATTEVPAGMKWEEVAGSFEQRKVPSNVRPSNAVSRNQQLTGRTAVRTISQGEILTSAQFGAQAEAGTGGLEIPPGTNGVSISMPLPQGVARYIQPGALINVYASFKGNAVGPEGNAPTTKLILSNVQVLANRPYQQGAEKAAAGSTGATTEVLLTLALSPDNAEKLIYAKENGALWFGLVRPGDAPASTLARTPKSALR